MAMNQNYPPKYNSIVRAWCGFPCRELVQKHQRTHLSAYHLVTKTWKWGRGRLSYTDVVARDLGKLERKNEDFHPAECSRRRRKTNYYLFLKKRLFNFVLTFSVFRKLRKKLPIPSQKRLARRPWKITSQTNRMVSKVQSAETIVID